MKQFIYPYIMYKDSIKAAEYYKEVFGGEITYIMYGKDTPNCPEDKLESVMHLQYKLKGSQFYMADTEIEDYGRIHIHLDFDNLEEMKAAFNKMKVESTEVRDVEETYWGAVFGSLKDKFSVTWQFHYSLPNE